MDYILIGIMLFCVVMSLGELATIFPVSGSFASYSEQILPNFFPSTHMLINLTLEHSQAPVLSLLHGVSRWDGTIGCSGLLSCRSNSSPPRL
jgi:amino acid transporter